MVKSSSCLILIMSWLLTQNIMKRTNKDKDEEEGREKYDYKTCSSKTFWTCFHISFVCGFIIFSETQSGSEKEPHNLLTIGLFIKIYVRLSSKLVYLWFIFQILLSSSLWDVLFLTIEWNKKLKIEMKILKPKPSEQK